MADSKIVVDRLQIHGRRFKMTHIEAKSINIWLIYDLFSKYTSQIVIYYLMLRIRLALAVKLNQLKSPQVKY